MKLNRIENSSDFKTDDGMFDVIADNVERGAYHLMFNGKGIFDCAISLDDCQLSLAVIYYFIGGGVNRSKEIRAEMYGVLAALNKSASEAIDAGLAVSRLTTAGFLTKKYFVDFGFDDVWDITADEYAAAVESKTIVNPEDGGLYRCDDFEVFYTIKATDKMIELAEWRENNKPQAATDLIEEIKALEAKLVEKKAELKAMGYHHE